MEFGAGQRGLTMLCLVNITFFISGIFHMYMNVEIHLFDI